LPNDFEVHHMIEKKKSKSVVYLSRS